MNRAHLSYLACPQCKQPLQLGGVALEQDGRVLEGILRCDHCPACYPVVRGIPRFVTQANYAMSFGYEWLRHARTQYDSQTGTHITEQRFFNETRWPRDLRGQMVLEVGGGSGRFTEHAAATGAMVVSFDYSEAVEANYASNGHRDNVLIVQADLYRMPFPDEQFHKLYCFGVLQHTPDVRRAFMALLPPLKIGGELVVDVYAKIPGIIPFLLRATHPHTWARLVTPHVSPARLYHFCRRYIQWMWPLARWLGRYPRVGSFLLRRLLIPPYFGVYDLADADLREWMILDMFDALSPRYESAQTLRDVRQWFREAGLVEAQVHYGYNGIAGRACRAVVPQRYPRIAQFASTFLPRIGGAEIVVHNLCARLQQAAYDVTLITWWGLWRRTAGQLPYRSAFLIPRTYTKLLRRLLSRGVDIRWLVSKQISLLQRRFGFDLWHIHMAYPAGVLAAETLNRMGVPFIITCQGDDIMTLPEKGYGVRLEPRLDQAIRNALKQSNMVTAISPTMHAELRALGVAEPRIADIPNAVEVSQIAAFPVARDDARRKLNWAGRIILLTVGRYDPLKGLELIPLIAKRILRERSDFLWILSGREVNVIAPQARAQGVADHLCFRLPPRFRARGMEAGDFGFSLPTTDLITIYRAADIFVMLSLIEGFSLVTVEAMAAGLPVVTTNAPGCADLVDHGRTGWVCPSGDVEAIAQAILSLMARPEQRAALGAQAQAASRAYDWPLVLQQYTELYSRILAQSRAPSSATVRVAS